MSWVPDTGVAESRLRRGMGYSNPRTNFIKEMHGADYVPCTFGVSGDYAVSVGSLRGDKNTLMLDDFPVCIRVCLSPF